MDRNSLRALRFEDIFSAADRGQNGVFHRFRVGSQSGRPTRSVNDSIIFKEHLFHPQKFHSSRSPPQRPQVPRPDLRMREGGRLGVCPDAHLGRGVRFTGGTSRVLEGDSQREGGRGGHRFLDPRRLSHLPDLRHGNAEERQKLRQFESRNYRSLAEKV